MSGTVQEPTSPIVELHIGELTLEGLPAFDGSLVRATVEQELTRLFTERGFPTLLARSGSFSTLNGSEFAVAPDSNEKAIGSRIAEAVYGGLSR